MAVDLEALKEAKNFIRVNDLAGMFGVTRAVIYRWINKGRIPPHVRLGGFVGWFPDDLRKALGVK